MKKIVVFIFTALVLVSVAYGQSNGPDIKITFLNQDPDPARAAETVEARFMVENRGGSPAEHVELEVIPEYPFSLLEGSDALQNLGTLYPYQSGKNSVTIKFKIKISKDAVKGQHELKVRSKYGNQGWGAVSYIIDVTSKEFAQIIYVDKAKLDPGKETEMKFTITNIGSAPLQNIIFSWNEKNGIILPVFSDDTKYVKYLDVGESAELLYIVVADVNAQPGLYQLDLKLKYESLETEDSEINTKAGIFVGGETDFDVSFSESSQGQTSLSVANAGNNPALSVSVKIPEQTAFRVTGSSSAIIGNLDKGDYTIVSFQIVSRNALWNGSSSRQRTQSQATPQVNNDLKVIIEYTDTTGERRSIEKYAPIQFRSASTEEGSDSSTQRSQQTLVQSYRGILITALIIALGLGIYVCRNPLLERIRKVIKRYGKK